MIVKKRVTITVDVSVRGNVNLQEVLAVGVWKEGENGKDDKILLNDKNIDIDEYIDIVEEIL